MASSTLNSAVEVAVTIGHIDAVITLVIAGVFALILIIVGIVLLIKQKVLIGIILVIAAFVVMLLAYLYYHFVTTNKGIAAVAGVAAVANVFGGGKLISHVR